MIYPQDFENRIGFTTVREDVAAKIETAGGHDLLDRVLFCSDFEKVRRSLCETAEMHEILYGARTFATDFPSRGYVDVGHILPKARVEGGFMEPAEMLQLGTALELLGSVVRFFAQIEKSDDFENLISVVQGIDSFEPVAKEVFRIVDKFGNVRDGASSELLSIRRSLAQKSSQISKRLQQILQKAQTDGYADADASVSVRDGRAVIPVAAGNKRKVKGFIFDESASGRTAYIEPLEVIELNNEVRELQSAERREIVRILTQFSDFLRPSINELIEAGGVLCYFDFLVAKARYAHQIHAVMPILDNRAKLYLRSARHPLLEKVFKIEGRAEALVPLNIELTDQKHILLISGPNAGGKSVCLKTVGLLQYMLQCGFLVPTLENSEMGVFDSVFLDIGDQQSLDDDLSTYSSHLRNMKTVLREATERSLVLIDEFGGGTEPNVGGAIAEAILEQIADRGTFGVITTHYANLKYFAASHGGIENGAMTFDVQKIQPLYSLEMGRAGSSFAFEIAHKIGLPQSVLQGAERRIGDDKLSLEKQLRQATRDKRYWELKREKIRVENKDVERIAQQYESELTDIQQSRSLLIKQAKQEAAAIVTSANALIEKTVREIREGQADRERTRVVRAEVEAFRAQVTADTVRDETIERKIEQLRDRERRRAENSQKKEERRKMVPEKPVVALVKLPVVVGSTVQLDQGQTMGEVLSINGKKAVVALGGLSTTVNVARLKVITQSKTAAKKSASPQVNVSESVFKSAMEFVNEIDIRGMRVVEALDAVRDFVDSAIVVGSHRVRILHGKGTGALKQEVRQYLQTEKMVKSARDEKEEFGGAGITVVEL